jgi:hypothetical protein
MHLMTKTTFGVENDSSTELKVVRKLEDEMTKNMISLSNKVNLLKRKYMYFIDPIFSVYFGLILNVTICLVDINCRNRYM